MQPLFVVYLGDEAIDPAPRCEGLRSQDGWRIRTAATLVTIACLMGSYFAVMLALYGYWGRAVAAAFLGMLTFGPALFAASLLTGGKPWRAFWIANIALSCIVGGFEAYALLTQQDPFAGGRLRPGFITTASGYNIVFDIVVWTVANFIGFYASRLLIRRFDIG